METRPIKIFLSKVNAGRYKMKKCTFNYEISVVIPCYNSAKSLPELIVRLTDSLNKITLSHEIIFVNDCSKDNTLSILEDIVNKYDNVKVIDLMYNVGQFKALYCGLETAKGKYIVTMDDDLQHPPEELHKLYTTISSNSNIDAVFGCYKQKQHSFIRNLGTKLIKKINEAIYNKPPNLVMSAFRIMKYQLVDTVINHRTISPVIGAIILKSTNRIINVEVEHHSRKYGASNYNFLKLVKTTFDNVLNFSSKPLQIISLIGIFVSFISFIFSIYIVIRYSWIKKSVPGWSSLMVMINFYSGLILICLGLIGEYLIRILLEVNGTPRYQIRSICESKKDVSS